MALTRAGHVSCQVREEVKMDHQPDGQKHVVAPSAVFRGHDQQKNVGHIWAYGIFSTIQYSWPENSPRKIFRSKETSRVHCLSRLQFIPLYKVVFCAKWYRWLHASCKGAKKKVNQYTRERCTSLSPNVEVMDKLTGSQTISLIVRHAVRLRLLWITKCRLRPMDSIW